MFEGIIKYAFVHKNQLMVIVINNKIHVKEKARQAKLKAIVLKKKEILMFC